MINRIIFTISIFIFLVIRSSFSHQWNRNLEYFNETQRRTIALSGNTIAWSPDSSFLAVGSSDKIFIFETRNFNVFKILRGRVNNVTSEVTSIAFSPDGKFLLSGHQSGWIFIWSTENWENVKAPWGMAWILNSGLVPCIKFSPDGKLIASGDWDNRVIIWNTKNWRKIKYFTGSIPSAEMNKVGSIWKSILLQIRSIDFSPDGKLLATGGNDRKVHIWNTSNWNNIENLTEPEHWVSSVAFSPNGKFLAAGDHEGNVFIWSSTNWNLNNSLSEHEIRCLVVSFSPDNKYLVSGGDNGELFLYKRNSWDHWEVFKKLKGHQNSVTALAFSPNGKYLATKGDNVKLIIWSTNEWSILKEIPIYYLNRNNNK